MVVNMKGAAARWQHQSVSPPIRSVQVFDVEYTVDVAKYDEPRAFLHRTIRRSWRICGQIQKQITNADLRNMMETVYADSTPYGKGDYILTDDKAPVETSRHAGDRSADRGGSCLL